MACKLCETRRPRRFCPGVRGDICAQCCGAERENTVECPLDCIYLQDAHKHERPAPPAGQDIPHSDITVERKLLVENSTLATFLMNALFQASQQVPGAVDHDMGEAIDALVRTYRTRQSGLYYDTRPENPVAAAVYEAIEAALGQFREREPRSTGGIHRTRDADVLGLLVFFSRLRWDRDNGRRRGRAFIGFLQSESESAERERDAAEPAPSSIILP